MHRGQESVVGTDVGEHLDLQQTGESQTPIALAGSDAGRETLGGIPEFEVVGVEVRGLVCIEGQGDRSVDGAGVAEGLDSHLAGVRRVVHDADETLPAVVAGGRPVRHVAAGPNRSDYRVVAYVLVQKSLVMNNIAKVFCHYSAGSVKPFRTPC